MVVRGWSSSPGAGGEPASGPRTAPSRPAAAQQSTRSLASIPGPLVQGSGRTPGVALRPSRGRGGQQGGGARLRQHQRAKIAPEEWLTVAVEPATTAGLGWPMSRTAPPWYRLRRQLARARARAERNAGRRGCLHPPGCKHHLLLALTLARVLVSKSQAPARHATAWAAPVAAWADVVGAGPAGARRSST